MYRLFFQKISHKMSSITVGELDTIAKALKTISKYKIIGRYSWICRACKEQLSTEETVNLINILNPDDVCLVFADLNPDTAATILKQKYTQLNLQDDSKEVITNNHYCGIIKSLINYTNCEEDIAKIFKELQPYVIADIIKGNYIEIKISSNLCSKVAKIFGYIPHTLMVNTFQKMNTEIVLLIMFKMEIYKLTEAICENECMLTYLSVLSEYEDNKEFVENIILETPPRRFVKALNKCSNKNIINNILNSISSQTIRNCYLELIA